MRTIPTGRPLSPTEVNTIITSYAGGSEQAAIEYRRLLDGTLRLSKDAERRRVALLQALRTIAEHRRPAGPAHGLTFFDVCPDCSSPVFDTHPVAVGEIRECKSPACGTEWRRRPRHRDDATYTKMEARTAKLQRPARVAKPARRELVGA